MTGDEIAFGSGEEFRLIRRFVRRMGATASGIGDDAALAHVPRDNALVVSTDTSIDGVHFRRDWITNEEIGFRSTTAALSDLAAMGAAPTGILIALTIPDGSRELLDALADGITRAANAASTRVLGGDTTRGPTLSMTFTVLGHAREPLKRTEARANHRVYVTGRLGGPGASVKAWNEGREPHALWRARFAAPAARIKEARWLGGQGARAAIDISDGLVADLSHIAAASHVHIDLDLDRVPLTERVRPEEAARSGEEYEIIVTSAIPIDTEAFHDRFRIPLTEIGVVRDGEPGVTITSGGVPVDIQGDGFDHFADR